MGKIRVKVLGDEQADKQKEAARAQKRAEKKALKEAEKAAAPVEETVTVEEVGEKKTQTVTSETKAGEPQPKADRPVAERKEKKAKFAKNGKRTHSKRYGENIGKVGKKTNYPLTTAIEMLKNFKKAKFDETVELHINVKEKGLAGQVSLPHGTGKTRKIKIVDDALIEQIEKGTIDFDVLVAHPSMMPKLAKVARILGPRGLMPNPKNGTVTPKPEEVVEKLAGGQVNFKTEPGAPVIHMSIGKISFDDKKIQENVMSALKAIQLSQIDKITIKSTMSPALFIDLNSVSK